MSKLTYRRQESNGTSPKALQVFDASRTEIAVVFVDKAIQVLIANIYPQQLNKIVAVAEMFMDIYRSLEEAEEKDQADRDRDIISWSITIATDMISLLKEFSETERTTNSYGEIGDLQDKVIDILWNYGIRDKGEDFIESLDVKINGYLITHRYIGSDPMRYIE